MVSLHFSLLPQTTLVYVQTGGKLVRMSETNPLRTPKQTFSALSNWEENYQRTVEDTRKHPDSFNLLRWACVLANWPNLFKGLRTGHRAELRKRLSEAVRNHHPDFVVIRDAVAEMQAGWLDQRDTKYSDRAYKKYEGPTDEQLEVIRTSLRHAFGALHTKEFDDLNSDLLVSATRFGVNRKRGGIFYAGTWIAAILLNVVRELDREGLKTVRRCAHCQNYFAGVGRKKFCSRPCLERDKNRRYRATPGKAADYNEDHALLMWRKGFNVKPSQTRIATWIKKYREKRCKREQRTSARPIDIVAKHHA